MSPSDHDKHNDDRQNRDDGVTTERSDGLIEPAGPEESAQAAEFAGLLDRVIAGDKLPAVMAAEQRELIETAAILRANLRADSSVGRGVSQVVSQVMSQAAGASQGATNSATATDDRSPEQHGQSDIIDLQARRRRRVRRLSVGSAALAAAAVLFFILRSPGPPPDDTQAGPTLSMIHHSRPADPLIGEIPRERADRASDRLDTIYADRMAGYRDLRLRGGGR